MIKRGNKKLKKDKYEYVETLEEVSIFKFWKWKDFVRPPLGG